MSTVISDYLQSLEDRIDAINSCEFLEEFANEIKEDLNDLIDDLTAKQAKLAAQITPPVDLATTIVWITAQINTAVDAVNAVISETALVIAKASEIVTKLENKVTTLGCSFTPPTIP